MNPRWIALLLFAAGCDVDVDVDDDGDSDFDFEDAPASAYVRVDRMGMPAVSTALITSKNAYNQASPTDDLEGDFVPEISANLTNLHAALDDDLQGLGLIPCAVQTCLAQGAPLIVPDTLKLDLSTPSGFPNGRELPDPVIDITLAVILLDLGAGQQNAGTLAGVPVNPPANDKAFLGTFPYLAPPHL